MTDAPAALVAWAEAELDLTPGSHRVTPVSGDASARQYFRLAGAGESWVLVHAPPDSEKNAEFLAVRELLDRAGIAVPALVGADLARGFLLLGDLGDRLLLDELDRDSVDACYATALELSLRFAGIATAGTGLPAYGEAILREELERFPSWYVQALLGLDWDAAARAAWAPLAAELVANARAQPQVLVHRDFHSRNLMPQADGRLAVIDFQDAVVGPLTYDPVSLLRDCYVRWPPSRVRDWALAYRQRLLAAGHLHDVDEAQFLAWFDLMGLQRHIKVLGTFARLYLRDDKPAYLQDLPRVLGYVRDVLEQYAPALPAVAGFAAWFNAVVLPVVEDQPAGSKP